MTKHTHILVVSMLAAVGLWFAVGYTPGPSETGVSQGQRTLTGMSEDEPSLTEEMKVDVAPSEPQEIEPFEAQGGEGEQPEPQTPEVTEGTPLIEEELPITFEVCHVPFEIGTYSMVTVETASASVFPILESRDSKITSADLEARTMGDGTIRVTVSRGYFERVGESQYCNTWEENDSCIGQWIDFEDGRIMMEAQNPC